MEQTDVDSPVFVWTSMYVVPRLYIYGKNTSPRIFRRQVRTAVRVVPHKITISLDSTRCTLACLFFSVHVVSWLPSDVKKKYQVTRSIWLLTRFVQVISQCVCMCYYPGVPCIDTEKSHLLPRWGQHPWLEWKPPLNQPPAMREAHIYHMCLTIPFSKIVCTLKVLAQ